MPSPDPPQSPEQWSGDLDRVDTPQGLEQALRSALTSNEMRVIELAVSFSKTLMPLPVIIPEGFPLIFLLTFLPKQYIDFILHWIKQ